jgi:cobalt/nickel transport system permease protein
VGGAHGDGLLVARDSPVHRLPSHCKLVALLVFVAGVVATPARQWWAFLAYAGMLALVVAVARVPALVVVRRSVVEVPFVVFAVLLPFVATGSRTEVLGLSLSEAGLLGAWNLLAKGTLGVVAAIVLAATTTPRDLLGGLDRLRLPRFLVAILGFMVRYAGVVTGDLQRMRVARESRCFRGGQLRHLRAEAAGVGSLFVRSYERGERVHQAMVARGYTGRMPSLSYAGATPAQWGTAAVLPLAAVAVASAAWVLA